MRKIDGIPVKNFFKFICLYLGYMYCNIVFSASKFLMNKHIKFFNTYALILTKDRYAYLSSRFLHKIYVFLYKKYECIIR